MNRTGAETAVAVMRELLCGENGELQNLTEDGHMRLCVLAHALCLYGEYYSDLGSMVDVGAFDRVMNDARWQEGWFFTLPFDKAIHGQLLAVIGLGLNDIGTKA